MDNPRAETVRRDLDALFHLGVVGGMSDGQLLERFMSCGQDGGQTAFEEVVRRHGSMVLGVCLRALGDSHSAEDAFQATFLVLALKARSVRKVDSLGPWLHGVAARVSMRARSQAARRRRGRLPAGPCGPGTAARRQKRSRRNGAGLLRTACRKPGCSCPTRWGR